MSDDQALAILTGLVVLAFSVGLCSGVATGFFAGFMGRPSLAEHCENACPAGWAFAEDPTGFECVCLPEGA